MEPTTKAASAKPSKVELAKLASQYLKTFVADELVNEKSHFSDDASSILKFHGSYQQDDRDTRRALKKEGKEPAFQFMVRVRIVGGSLTALQYLACDQLAQTVGNGTLRITTRQEFQLHGVLKARPENDDPATSTKACSRPWRPAGTSSGTCCAARRPSMTACAGTARRRDAMGIALRPAVELVLGHLGGRRENRDRFPTRARSLVKTAGDDAVEPALRQDLSSPQVQDRVCLS